ncbi:MAG: CDP-alcohol phosphatidyltransferase family protein [Bacteroidales bacterium]|nr:CDP-alcohol phosphatidyltransferase family protein [Bacteroidales bacterium]
MNILHSLKRQVPNFITLGNLLCGVLAVGFAVGGALYEAALFICIGILLDFFDGLAARLLNVVSPIGKELDSLADVVTSGIAPAYILYALLDNSYNCFGNIPLIHRFSYVAFLMPLFAAYRLAKFNLDTRQGHGFLGLPVPSNALIWVGIALTTNCCTFIAPNTPGIIVSIVRSPILPYCLIAVSLITDILMVSELPMFSLKFNFKDLSWSTNHVQYIFLIGCAAIICATRQWYAISLIILWYILYSLLTQRKHTPNEQ